jgi:hypothetical protein
VGIAPGTTGFTFGGSPITSSGNITISGQLSILNGGTGANSAQLARNNLMPEQATHTGQFLTTDGTEMFWADVPSASGTVSSVNISGGSTGLTFNGGPITTSGTITAAGVLSILNGGTGAQSAPAAINALLPGQAGNTGKFLSTNGTAASWQEVVRAAAGGDTQVQFNNNGVLGSSASLVVDKSTGALTSASRVTGASVFVAAASGQNRPLVFATLTSPRWELKANADAESGSSAGSNFEFLTYSDTQTSSQVFTAARSTQVVDFKKIPTINGLQVGYLNLPVTTTFNSDARGKRVVITAGLTVPANTYSAGDAFSFYNNSDVPLVITQGSGMTLRQDGTSNTGNRTLLGRGSCFIWFLSATESIISGSLT